MFLNKSCAELPHVIQHPFHPHHQLTLSYSLDHLLGKKIRCNACLLEDYALFFYGCDLCEFYLHPKCASPILYPMIYMSELHQHPLAYSDNIPYESKCSKCTQNIIRAGFRCVHCKFDVHDHCLPLLPPAVKIKWHRHPLILTHGPIKGDPDEVYFYCDCCEDERDLKHPTYYCAKCHLISHVRCVMWEVMDYLQGKSTKVEKQCNTKVILIGEAEAMYSIYAAAAGNKDRVLRLRYKIDKTSAELMELEAKSEKYQKKYVATSLKLKEENRLYKCIAHKTELK